LVGSHGSKIPDMQLTEYINQDSLHNSHGNDRGGVFVGMSDDQIAWLVCKQKLRPEFTAETPIEMQELICSCWNADMTQRPSAEHVLTQVLQMMEKASSEIC
jgi:hypothetical protein